MDKTQTSDAILDECAQNMDAPTKPEKKTVSIQIGKHLEPFLEKQRKQKENGKFETNGEVVTRLMDEFVRMVKTRAAAKKTQTTQPEKQTIK